MAERSQIRLQALVENKWFRAVVITMIVINALVLGAETFYAHDSRVGVFLTSVDRVILWGFIAEIALRIAAYRLSYFKSGWNLFDFLIVAMSIVAATSGLAALRAFRVLRVLRVVTVMPRMRVVVSALLDSIPGIASVGVVLALIVYVFAVIAANLYGGDNERFGDVFAAMYTLFQVMTLEGWPDIADSVRDDHPNSWIFFLSFLLIATFTMLNLFVAIVVRVVEEDSDPLYDDLLKNQIAIREEIAKLSRDIEEISRRLER